MTAAAISAAFADWKLIRTRGVVQLVFELPIEHADKAYQALGGMPNPAESVWCAIARLEDDKAEMPITDLRTATGPQLEKIFQAAVGDALERDKRKFAELMPAQQAGILCNDPTFDKFLRTAMFARVDFSGWKAADIVRWACCNIKSRSELVADTPAGRAWKDMESKFRAWQREPEVVG